MWCHDVLAHMYKAVMVIAGGIADLKALAQAKLEVNLAGNTGWHSSLAPRYTTPCTVSDLCLIAKLITRAKGKD